MGRQCSGFRDKKHITSKRSAYLKARRSWRAFSLRHHPSTNANATLRQPIAAHPAQPQVAIYSSTLWPRGRYSSFVGLRNYQRAENAQIPLLH